MSVRLDAPPTGCLGAFVTKGGERFVTLVERLPNGRFSVRVENGWYYDYGEDGVRRTDSRPRGPNDPPQDFRDIVEFRVVDHVEGNRLIDEGWQWGLNP